MDNRLWMYAYAGPITSLIPAGYEFQKLYAGNHKSYRKDGIIMYVVSSMVLLIDRVDGNHQKALIDFILDNLDQPESFWKTSSTKPNGWVIDTHHWVLTKHGRVVSIAEYRELQAAYWKALPKDISNGVSEEVRAMEGARDEFNITPELVAQIKGLMVEDPLTLIGFDSE